MEGGERSERVVVLWSPEAKTGRESKNNHPAVFDVFPSSQSLPRLGGEGIFFELFSSPYCIIRFLFLYLYHDQRYDRS